MPFTITVDPGSFDSKKWEQTMLEELRKGQPCGIIHSNVRDGLFPACFLLPEGGMRGVYVELREPNLLIEVPSPASRADFALARFLTVQAVSHGATVSVDGERGLDEAEWEAAREQLWHITLKASLDDSSPLTLPCGPFALKLSADQRGLPANELEEILVGKAARYGAAFQATSIKRGDGVIIGAFAFGDTFIRKNVQRVMYDPHGGTTPGLDVNVEEFMQALGGCEEHQGSWFLPGFDTQSETGKSRLADLNRKLGVDASVYEQKPEFTEEMFQVIRLSPYLVFFLVAAADGEVDEKEQNALTEIIRVESQTSSDAFLAKILASSPEEHAALFQRARAVFAKVGPRALQMANKVGTEHLGEAWRDLARWLCELGSKIASASGGGWFGSKISEEEKKSLQMLAEILGVHDAS